MCKLVHEISSNGLSKFMYVSKENWVRARLRVMQLSGFMRWLLCFMAAARRKSLNLWSRSDMQRFTVACNSVSELILNVSREECRRRPSLMQLACDTHSRWGWEKIVTSALCEFCFCARNQVAAARSLFDELNPLSSWRDLSLYLWDTKPKLRGMCTSLSIF